jgi:hypothetical protein
VWPSDVGLACQFIPDACDTVGGRDRSYAAGVTCRGSLVLPVIGGAVACCTLDDEPEGCAGIELRHEGDPDRLRARVRPLQCLRRASALTLRQSGVLAKGAP